jgi:hypothetical protein
MARALDNPTTRVCLALPFLASELSELASWQAGVVKNAACVLEPV